MPIFIPPYMGEEIKSNAERKMFDVLQELNLKNTYVLHSLGLPRHQTKIYGEIDFVVVCDRGIACLEIKGGRVECREGKWIFTNRYGEENIKPEGPFAQVTGNMFSLRNVLKKRFPDNRHMKNLLVACGVVFPDIEFRSRGQEVIPEIVYDKSTADITEYLNQIFDYWESRQHREPSRLSPADIKEITAYLRGEFSFIPSLADRLEDVDRRLVRLTSEQALIMDALAGNDHLMINGCAGTGKTLLAMDFAKKKAEQGNRVLYLTFNKNLSKYLLAAIGEDSKLKVINIHALFGEFVPVDTGRLDQNPQRYFAEDLPDAFFDHLSTMDENALEELKYDVLVMDEGQDIIKPNYLYSLDYLLRDGFQNGHWAVFYDEKQNIYNPEYQDGLELLESYHPARFQLRINCRNTIQIGKYSEKVSGWEIGGFLRENGEEVRKLSYKDEADFKVQAASLLKRLRSEKVKMSEVTFLSPKKYRNSILCGAGIKVYEISSDLPASPELPRFSTIHGFKGLDSKVVILCDLDSLYDSSYSKFMYIAATRARTLLYIAGSEAYFERHGF